MDNILSSKFAYYDASLKNQSEKDIEKRISSFELELKFLGNVMNGYNQLNSGKQIRMIEIKE